MAEWLVEAGIGETRAALVEDGAILEAVVEPHEDGPRAGAILPARLVRLLVPGRRGLALLESGVEALVEPLPAGVTEGAAFLAEVVREAIVEPGAVKRARVRRAPPGAVPVPGPALADRVDPARPLPAHGPDLLEAAGWSELIEEARTGAVAFPGGALRISLTPAMTLIDVDGPLDPATLMIAGTEAAVRTIRRMGIAGSIGIDLPTVESRDARQAAAAVVDRLLPQPFERTAVNGFGFLQIVRRRTRTSLPERLRDDPAGAAARALLRRAERTPGAGPVTLAAAPAVIARIPPDWVDEAARRIGAPLRLLEAPSRPIWGGDVQRPPL